tara:strand:+ start:2237 stop:2464 length:228 start_codon:yes stop_codon:yes gene_type:complete
MSGHVKYGFCRYNQKWVKRDEMLGLNIKVFDENNNEERISIRLSKEGHASLVKMLSLLRWDNILMTSEELSKFEN